MAIHTVGKASSLSEDNLIPLVVSVEGVTIGIYKFNGRYFAYENECAHEGGPVVEGLIVGDVVCKISPEGRRLGEYFSETKMDIVCPWHGVPYDLETGISRSDERFKLVAHEVIVEGDDLKIRI